MRPAVVRLFVITGQIRNERQRRVCAARRAAQIAAARQRRQLRREHGLEVATLTDLRRDLRGAAGSSQRLVWTSTRR